MKHAIQIAGPGFRLRPVELSDASFIVKVRLGEEKRNRFVHPISPDPKLQESWLREYFDRAGDYYFVIENRSTGQPEGLVGLYDVGKENHGWGEWRVSANPSITPSARVEVV